MNPFAERLRAIVARYLEGQQSLDSAATDYARVWREWTQAREAGRPTTLPELLVDRPDMDVLQGGEDLGPGLTEKQVPRLEDLLDLAFQKLSHGDKGAA